MFAGLFGLLLGLSLLKFGNPAIMEKYVERPADWLEWVFSPWPVAMAYWLLGGVAVVGLLVARWKTGAPGIIAALPLVWLAWQLVAASRSINPQLTRITLVHFTTCAICFYLGLFSLSRAKSLLPFWAGLLGGFLLVLVSGFQQHFGGLEETRRYFFLYIYPTLKEVPPPEFLKKMTTNRIFATLFYPNALAGVILLLLPAMLAVVWSMKRWLTIGARGLLMAMAGVAALACLYWSGSKGGWLLMLLLGFVAALHLPFKRQMKLMLVGGMLVLGLAGFFWKYSGFFKKGATSVVARFDYWEAALKTAWERPVFGTGPGTFATAYSRIKKPESEPSKLAHNDYLQQASDSGVIGFLAYAGLIIGCLVHAYRNRPLTGDWVTRAVWLGILGWALQSTVEFGLYIPALAWPAFALMGWLLGQSSNRIDRQTSAR